MRTRDIDALIARLAGDTAGSDVREARAIAKWRAPHHPALRRALAEHYRRLGDSAQAGRWGIVFPGWAKPHEIARARLFLLSHADNGNFVRHYLSLGGRTPIPPEVLDLVAPSYRARAPKDGSGGFLLGCGGAILLVSGIFAAIFETLRALWFGLTGHSSNEGPEGFIVIGAVTTIGILALLPAMLGPSSHAKSTDRGFALQRALELLEEHPAEGRAMLRSLAWTIDDPTIRHALVADARRRGRFADAGRWGCTEVGLSTPEERDAYAATIRRKQGSTAYERVMNLSAAWGEDSAPGDVVDVLRRAGTTPPDPLPQQTERRPPRLWRWCVPLGVLPLGAVGTTLFPASAPAISAGAVATWTGAWALVCLLAARVKGRPKRHRALFAASAVVLAVATAGFGVAAL